MMDESYGEGPQRDPIGLILNLVTLGVLLVTLIIGGTLIAIFLNPQIPLNPFPPPTLPATLGFPTPTNTPEIYLPPTWTPSPAVAPTATSIPTEAPTGTVAPTEQVEEPTSEPPETGFAFELQPGSPVAIPNIAQSDLGCEWMGVGGQVFDEQGGPISPGVTVHLQGNLNGVPISLDTLSGSATALGPAGYVFQLADEPMATQGSLWIELRDTDGTPLSERLYLTTYDSCEQNLVLANWHKGP
jgi:hypothetical protein